MRTVTFSDKAVIDAVDAACVPTWTNRVPEFHNCEFHTEEEILATSPDTFPTKNFCTYFCTPDRKVLHYFTGYYCPKAFLDELEFVESLLRDAVDDTGAVKADVFKTMHGERVAQRGTRGLFADAEEEFDESDRVGLRRAWSRHEGGRHLDEINRWMEKHGPPDLKDAIKKHLSGNSFSEERSKPKSKP